MPSAVLRVDCRKDDQIKSKDYLQIVRDKFSDHSEKTQKNLGLQVQYQNNLICFKATLFV